MRLSAPIFRLKRQAKLLARETSAPLHASLDQVAKREGFRSWSHLATSNSEDVPARKLLAHLAPGDLMLLGGRPGHGKTLLALQLALEAARAGRPSFYFSLEEAEAVISERLRGLGSDKNGIDDAVIIDTSDSICADYIIARARNAGESLVVVDYLQLLDQRRKNPELAVQVASLAKFARTAPSTIVTVSQIDRSFDVKSKPLPDLADVRLPNPIDLALFTKTCFLHNGKLDV